MTAKFDVLFRETIFSAFCFCLDAKVTKNQGCINNLDFLVAQCYVGKNSHDAKGHAQTVPQLYALSQRKSKNIYKAV